MRGYSWIFALVMLGLVGARQAFVTYSNYNTQQQLGDMRQLVKPDKDGKRVDPSTLNPQTEMGKEMKAAGIKMEACLKRLEEGVKAHPIDNVLDWDRLITPEGRTKSLAELDANYAVYKQNLEEEIHIRGEMHEIVSKYSHETYQSPAVEYNAEDGRLLRARAELYDSYRRTILVFATAKHVDKFAFSDKADAKAYEDAQAENHRLEKAYDDLGDRIDARRAQETARAKQDVGL